MGLFNLSMMKPWMTVPKLTEPVEYELEKIISQILQ